MKIKLGILALIVFVLSSCKDPKTNGSDKPNTTETPRYELKFNADSAYQFVQEQVDFGPRVPGTMEHAMAANYLETKLALYCDTGFIQSGQMTNAKGQTIQIKNIIGSFNTGASKRILLCAHWDTRPQADEDPDKPTTPADGANDGGSGVGVLLEIARQLSIQRPDTGVDIVLFDAEDGGDRQGGAESWCLGSQYWAKKTHVPNYVARFGILLDMVGEKDATFFYEGFSLEYARPYVEKVWNTASSLGHSKYFVKYKGSSITDDHYFVNSIKGIPTLDIIQHDTKTQSGFGHYWHTHKDNMSVIDRNTLKAVGETVFKVVMEF
jgi:hypothetical protein